MDEYVRFIIGAQLRWQENTEYARSVGHMLLWPVIDINIQLVSPHIVYWHYLFINQNSKVTKSEDLPGVK